MGYWRYAELNRMWATITVIMDPYQFFTDQIPNHPITVEKFSRQAEAQTLQIGNIFVLLAAMAVICCWTKHREVAKWYLLAVAFADWGHMYASARGVGLNYTLDVRNWSAMFGGNFGVSAFLNLNRWLTVLDVFGTISNQIDSGKKNK